MRIGLPVFRIVPAEIPRMLPGLSPVIIGDAALSHLLAAISAKKYSQLFVLCDTQTAQYCYPHLSDLFPAHHLLTIPAGEKHKTLASCAEVWAALSQTGADRHAAMVCVGGGVVCDLGGFCAATYKRGIACFLVPTTTLAMIDASVGGKTGIDFEGFKNQIGTFTQPAGIFMWPGFLSTLPPREVKAGLAEAIKHSLIADATAWNRWSTLPSVADITDWEQVIREAVATKSAIVARDPHEAGERKALNFGHTIGHAIESHCLSADYPLLHGECVALGMVAESAIARELGLLSAAACDEVTAVLARLFADIPFTELPDILLNWTLQDKKNRNGSVRVALPAGIGACRWDIPVEWDLLHVGLAWCRKKMLPTT